MSYWEYVNTVYHESFEAKNLRGQCITQIFTKKLSRIPIVIAISARFSIATEIFHGKSFAEQQKTAKTAKLFCLETFMVYGMFVWKCMEMCVPIAQFQGITKKVFGTPLYIFLAVIYT